MTPNEVGRMVQLLIATWPAGVRGYVWTDVLTPMQHDLAHATYLGLRRHSDKPPSVAKFEEEYRARQRARRLRAQEMLPLFDEPTFAPNHPRAITAFERGLDIGRSEMARMEAQRVEREQQYLARKAEREAREAQEEPCPTET